MIETMPFDAARYLNTKESQDLYLKEVAKEKDASEMLKALITVARAKGMMTQEKDFEDINHYLKSLGFRLTLEVC